MAGLGKELTTAPRAPALQAGWDRAYSAAPCVER